MTDPPKKEAPLLANINGAGPGSLNWNLSTQPAERNGYFQIARGGL